LQVIPHELPSQEALPFGSAAHGVQRVPQVAGAVSETQATPQRWRASLQVQACAATSQVSLAAHWVSNAQPGLHSPVARSQ
jgi:hypothetical protein